MDGYLSKPLRPPELDEILKKYSTGRKEIPQPAETTVQGN
jgi:DNA-binding NarL/FixJ family response regulator